MSGTLGIVAAAGAFLLLAVIIFAWASNKSKRNVGQAEAGARRLREDINDDPTTPHSG